MITICSCENYLLHPLPWQLSVPVHLSICIALSVIAVHCGRLTLVHPQQRDLSDTIPIGQTYEIKRDVVMLQNHHGLIMQTEFQSEESKQKGEFLLSVLSFIMSSTCNTEQSCRESDQSSCDHDCVLS